MRLARAALILACATAGPLGAQTSMSPQEIHDRLVALIRNNATRPIPQGDTLVTWSPQPNLYTTVHRTPDSVVSSLVRADAMVGTAQAAWHSSRQTGASVMWSQRDSTLLFLDFKVNGSAIEVSGSRTAELALPAIPWAIADYGMEDQLLPLLVSLAEATTVAIYRPFPGKWDTLTVVAQRRSEATLITITTRSGDGEEWRWVVGPNGAVLRIIRSNFPDFERTPLPESALMPAFRQYGSLTGSF